MGAVAGHALILHAQQTLDLGQFRVSLLESGGPTHEYIQAEVIADRHLVGQASEVPVHLGDLLS